MIVLLSLCAWVYLFFAHGAFWRSRPQLGAAVAPQSPPDVDIIVPARDEAETIRAAIASLLAQDYAGKFGVLLVDDNSTDGTADLAGADSKLRVLRLDSKPAGWSGKLWAVREGIAATGAPIVLLTDADIVHDPAHLTSLVSKLIGSHLDLVSEMVRLNCCSLAERVLVPAFVYFFQMLYPFARVNQARSQVAAAAGGTVLIRRQALERIGGIETIKDALIDDVALARAVKPGGPIYLGHSGLAVSIRRYPRLCRYLAHDFPDRLYPVALLRGAAARDDRRARPHLAGAPVGGRFLQRLAPGLRGRRVYSRSLKLHSNLAPLPARLFVGAGIALHCLVLYGRNRELRGESLARSGRQLEKSRLSTLAPRCACWRDRQRLENFGLDCKSVKGNLMRHAVGAITEFAQAEIRR